MFSVRCPQLYHQIEIAALWHPVRRLCARRVRRVLAGAGQVRLAMTPRPLGVVLQIQQQQQTQRGLVWMVISKYNYIFIINQNLLKGEREKKTKLKSNI